jgi:hypothetical protein
MTTTDRPALARRAVLRLSGLALAAACLPAAASTAIPATVHKNPWCGCCLAWVAHLERHGFAVTVVDVEDLAPLKQKLGVPVHLASCHTAEIDGYTIEGHVPAEAIHRLLDERPAVAGLAVPGMPAGSPGMESDMPEAYDVIAFGPGVEEVFLHVGA